MTASSRSKRFVYVVGLLLTVLAVLQTAMSGAVLASPTTQATSPTPANQQEADSPYAVYGESGELLHVVLPDGSITVEPSLLVQFPAQLDSGTSAATWKDAAHEIEQLATIDGVYFDEKLGELVFIGAPCEGTCTGLQLDDLLVAIQSVNAGVYPGVSIDPGPHRDEMVVRYIGQIADTHFGTVMFEADRLMKNLGSGVDNESGQPITVESVPGHRTSMMLSAELEGIPGSGASRSNHRYWIVIEDAQFTTAGNATLIDEVKLRVHTELLDENWQSIPSSEAIVDVPAQAFADQLTEHFDAYATEFPTFAELNSLARMTTLAQWMHDNALLPVDSPLITMKPAQAASPKTTPAITATLVITSQNGNRIRTETYSVWGGVDLTAPNRYIAASRLDKIDNAIRYRPAKKARTWTLQNGITRAVAVPIRYLQTLGTFRHTIDAAALVSGSRTFAIHYDSMRDSASDLGLGWQTNLPQLLLPNERAVYQEIGELHPSLAILDQNLKTPIRFRGPLVETNTRDIVYQREDAPDEFVRIQPDGTFVWQNQKGEHFIYHEDGRLRSWSDGTHSLGLTYNPDGTLASVENEVGERREFLYNPAGMMREVLEASDQIQSIRSFTYNDRNLLETIYDADKKELSHHTYDSFARRLATWSPSRLLFFDWRADSPRVHLANEADRKYIDTFGSSELERLAAIREMNKESATLGTVIYLRLAGDTALLRIGNEVVELPSATALSPERMRAALLEHGMLPAADEPVFVADGDGANVDWRRVLPNNIVRESEGLNVKEIVFRVATAANKLVTPESTSIFVGIPENEEQLANVAFSPDDQQQWQPEGWQAIKADMAASLSGIDADFSPTRDRVLEALATQSQVVVVFAHGDGQTIYFPNGDTLDTSQSIDEHTQREIEQNSPTVVLLSCEGASVDNTESFAKWLLDIGAGTVIAPTSEIGAASSGQLLADYIQALDGTDPISAFHKVLRSYKIKMHFRVLFGWQNLLGSDTKELAG